jgi:hypothetical protein
MAQPELVSRNATVVKKADGKSAPLDLTSGKRHQIDWLETPLSFDHRYHDNSPVCQAPFLLEFADGSQVRGTLDVNGRATVRHLTAEPVRVQFGSDARPFMLPQPPKNATYKSQFYDSDADALAQKAPQRIASAAPAEKALLTRVGGWIWGTVQGNFNEQQSTSQVIVDAVISCIPVLGEVTDIRDVIAIVLGMANDPKKREDKWAWLDLTVTLLALIPVVGGALKGVGKLLARGAKNARIPTQAIGECIAFLNRMGWGKAHDWLKQLNLEKHTANIAGQWRQICQRTDQGLTSVRKSFGRFMPEEMLQRIEQLQQAIGLLKAKGEAMIPHCVKELNRVLKEVQQQVYQGEWHAIPKSKISKTREFEARLINTPTGKKWVASDMPFPPSDPKKNYRHVDGWPDLETGTHVKMKGNNPNYETIESFSGNIRPVKLAPGTKIYRIIEHNSRSNGLFWATALPPNGKVWREEYAVLERWSGNGFYVEMTVPKEGLFVWEGKVASQLDADKITTKKGRVIANASEGQFLPGGAQQLVIDFDHVSNQHAQQVAKSLPRKRTLWTKDDLEDINVPDQTVSAQVLAVPEKATKMPEWLYEKSLSTSDKAVTAHDLHESQTR